MRPEHFRQLAGLIPGAKLVVIPDVSHGGTLQDPARFHQQSSACSTGAVS